MSTSVAIGPASAAAATAATTNPPASTAAVATTNPAASSMAPAATTNPSTAPAATPPAAPTLGEQLHLQTRRPRTTLALLFGVVCVAFANEHLSAEVSFAGTPLRLFLAIYVVCIVGAALTIKRGVWDPVYLVFNCSETTLLTLGIGGLVAIGGTAHSLLWLVYFSTVLHGARAAIYRRFNRILFSVAPLVVVASFLWQRNPPAALLSFGLGGAALYLYRLFLAAGDRALALELERNRLRQVVTDLAIVEERARLARDLHDGFGASLNAAIWHARRHSDLPEIHGIEDRLMACLDDLGAMVWAARREDQDLATFWSHLRARCDDLFGAELDVSYDFPDDDGRTSLDDRVAVATMFIVFEALRNCVRHAGAARATVLGRFDAGAISIEVRDDGAGFDPATVVRGHGLLHMGERASGLGGTLAMRSRPGETVISAQLPITAGPTAGPRT